METMFGVGLMLGPFVGGLLYELDGFYLPFATCGSALLMCAGLGFCALKPGEGRDDKGKETLGQNTESGTEDFFYSHSWKTFLSILFSSTRIYIRIQCR